MLVLRSKVWTTVSLHSDLPQLTVLIVGDITDDSYNFYYCETLSIDHLPRLRTLQLGDDTFFNFHSFSLVDLAQLEEIVLGDGALHGNKHDSSVTVVMKSNGCTFI